MEQFIFIVTVISGLLLSVVNISVQNAKRTVNKWAKEVLESGRIISRKTSELETIYSNPFSDWFLEIEKDHRLQVLRNSTIREKVREYRRFRKIRDILAMIFLPLLILSFYLFTN